MNRLVFIIITIIINAEVIYTQEIDFSEYFPHKVGDTWQYVDNGPIDKWWAYGFVAPDTFEIRITKVDTLEDGSKYVYVNNNHTPRWYIDSFYVYLMPSQLKIFSFHPDSTMTWWVTPDTSEFFTSTWRLTGSRYYDEILGEEREFINITEWQYCERGDTSEDSWYNTKVLTERYVRGIGFVDFIKYSGASGPTWELTGCIVGGDTLGTIIDIPDTGVFDWFPVQVGNLWQYEDTWSGEITEERITGVDTTEFNMLDVYVNGKLRYTIDYHNDIVYLVHINTLFMFNASMREPWWYENWENDELYDRGWAQLEHVYYGIIYGITKKFRVYRSIIGVYAGQEWTSVPGYGDIYFAKDIGRVLSIVDLGYPYILRGAVINGETFGTIVSVEAQEKILPGHFTLLQNYPNPFNPSTVIEFKLPEQSKITLEVYDILGRRIEVLVDEVLNHGIHRITWKPQNLPSGVYVYRIVAGEYIQSKRMTYIE
jgi:hypothetical protein